MPSVQPVTGLELQVVRHWCSQITRTAGARGFSNVHVCAHDVPVTIHVIPVEAGAMVGVLADHAKLSDGRAVSFAAGGNPRPGDDLSAAQQRGFLPAQTDDDGRSSRMRRRNVGGDQVRNRIAASERNDTGEKRKEAMNKGMHGRDACAENDLRPQGSSNPSKSANIPDGPQRFAHPAGLQPPTNLARADLMRTRPFFRLKPRLIARLTSRIVFRTSRFDFYRRRFVREPPRNVRKPSFFAFCTRLLGGDTSFFEFKRRLLAIKQRLLRSEPCSCVPHPRLLVFFLRLLANKQRLLWKKHRLLRKKQRLLVGETSLIRKKHELSQAYHEGFNN
jgi:hypothetical protein